MPRTAPVPVCQCVSSPVIVDGVQVATILRCVTSRGKSTRIDVLHHDPADPTNINKLIRASIWRTEPRSPSWHGLPAGSVKGFEFQLSHLAAANMLVRGAKHGWTADEIARHIIPHLTDTAPIPSRAFRLPQRPGFTPKLAQGDQGAQAEDEDGPELITPIGRQLTKEESDENARRLAQWDIDHPFSLDEADATP